MQCFLGTNSLLSQLIAFLAGGKHTRRTTFGSSKDSLLSPRSKRYCFVLAIRPQVDILMATGGLNTHPFRRGWERDRCWYVHLAILPIDSNKSTAKFTRDGQKCYDDVRDATLQCNSVRPAKTFGKPIGYPYWKSFVPNLVYK